MKNLKISRKLAISFGSLLVIFIFAVSTFLYNLDKANDLSQKLFEGPYVLTNESMGIRRDLANIARNINNTFLENNQNGYREVILSDFEDINKRIEKLNNASKGDSKNIAIINEYQQYANILKEEYEKIYNTASDENFKGTILDIDAAKWSETFKKFEQSIIKFSDEQQTQGILFNKKVNEVEMRTKYISILISATSIAIGVTVCIYIIRSLKRPIEELEIAAHKMSQGDFDIEISYESKDELGVLSNSILEMSNITKLVIQDTVRVLEEVANSNFAVTPEAEYIGVYKDIEESLLRITNDLSETISQINISSEEVGAASEQVASGAQMLSQGATEQASAIEELSATIIEISDKIKDTADNAKEANSLSISAGRELEIGNGQMKEMITAMEEISGTSNEIGRIIKTIDDIAFQTNILALNAAVEAARAGAAGKGFAVVADEVRNLAAKSAEAAKNTATLIENSIKAVNNGSEIVDNTASSLQRIIETSAKSISLIDEIAKSSYEQANAVSQVTLGVEQISNVVQINSATAEESAAASEELSGQAQMLKSLIEKFKLKEE